MNFDRTPLPVDSETISTYTCFLSEEFKSSDYIRNYISGIKTWAIVFKHNVDNLYSPSVKLTLNGLDKHNIRIPNQRLPLLVLHLFQLYECIDQENLSDFLGSYTYYFFRHAQEITVCQFFKEVIYFCRTVHMRRFSFYYSRNDCKH